MLGFRTRLAVAGALLIALAGCGKDAGSPAATDSPEGTVQAAVANLKAGDLKGLMESQLPPAELDKMRAKWKDKIASEPPTEEERVEFQTNMAELTAPDAETKLMEKLEPQIAQFEQQYAAQFPIMVGMGREMMASSIDQNAELNAQQKTEAKQALDALAKWLQSTNFTDRAKAKSAIADVVAAARALELKTVDDVRALSFDQAMEKGSIAFQGVKKVLAQYGFSLDQILDTVKVETVSSTADTATVKVSYEMLGQPLVMQSEMVKLDGRWYGKQTIESLKKAAAEATGTEEPAAIAPMDAPADGEAETPAGASDENG